MAKQKKHSKVLGPEVLKQAVLNTSSSLELLREAVSNSVDAKADEINIRLENRGGELWDVTIEDNGNGMEEPHMEAFFNAGDSQKDYPVQAIGEKGLGSKTTFVAKEIEVESIRAKTGQVILGLMVDPMDALKQGEFPEWALEVGPKKHDPKLVFEHGTRIHLKEVRISSFNGKKCEDPEQVADRTLHYLRSLCATGTVKNRHAARPHIITGVMNVGVIPMITLEVVMAPEPPVLRGPYPGLYPIPDANTAPSGGPTEKGIDRNSVLFADLHDFHRSKTITVDGQSHTVHYEGTAVIAGEHVRATMLRHELKQGWTQKSQMGVHYCKDFIPMRVDTQAARQLTGGSEYYYEFKIFINSQAFQLNADRNVITNHDHDEVSWIEEDFQANVWPDIRAKHETYASLRDAENSAIEAAAKTEAVVLLKTEYSKAEDLRVSKQGADLAYVKAPVKEADVSHLLAMMLQSGMYEEELAPLAKFGRYIDDSTDVICEDKSGISHLVEVEMRLTNLFRHKHPMQSYDYVVVWSLGGMASGESREAPWGPGGGRVSVTLIRDEKRKQDRLQWGTHKKQIFVLSDFV